jgi:hypothetical protein
MTVERLENEMSADELNEWVEFYSLEPFGDEERMNDKRHGVLCSVVANTGFQRYEQSPTASDFEMYSNKEQPISAGLEPEEMSDEQIKDAQSAILRIMTTK